MFAQIWFWTRTCGFSFCRTVSGRGGGSWDGGDRGRGGSSWDGGDWECRWIGTAEPLWACLACPLSFKWVFPLGAWLRRAAITTGKPSRTKMRAGIGAGSGNRNGGWVTTVVSWWAGETWDRGRTIGIGVWWAWLWGRNRQIYLNMSISRNLYYMYDHNVQYLKKMTVMCIWFQGWQQQPKSGEA